MISALIIPYEEMGLVATHLLKKSPDLYEDFLFIIFKFNFHIFAGNGT